MDVDVLLLSVEDHTRQPFCRREQLCPSPPDGVCCIVFDWPRQVHTSREVDLLTLLRPVHS